MIIQKRVIILLQFCEDFLFSIPYIKVELVNLTARAGITAFDLRIYINYRIVILPDTTLIKLFIYKYFIVYDLGE